MAPDPGKKTTGRREAYRDYEERDLEEGWPYADGAPETSKPPANRAYGETDANFDEADNVGFERSDETAIDSHGGPTIDKSGTHSAIEDDGLEERLFDALELGDDSGIRIDVDDGVVALEGFVETEEERQAAERRVASAAGVRRVVNRLRLSSVDADFPTDDT